MSEKKWLQTSEACEVIINKQIFNNGYRKLQKNALYSA